ncbi:transcriptional regulator [unidentified eubacterium SCB49]|nr:transcriptional regulator [unidentified eubacterium SCB49]
MKISEVIKSKNMSLSSQIVINLAYTSRVVEESIISILKNYDLTIQQYNVLRILRGQKGNPANLSTIQERMVDRNSNTTRLIDKLIKKQLVKRQVCKDNRRKIEVFITEKGLALLTELDPITENHNNKCVKGFSTEELETLNSLLDKLRSN